MKRNISTGSSGWAEHFDVASHLILSKPSEVGTVITLMLQIRKLSCTGVSHLPGSPSLAMAEPGSQPAPTQPPKTLTPPTPTTHCQELPIPPLFQTHPCLQGELQPPTTQGSSAFSHCPPQSLLCCPVKQPQPLWVLNQISSLLCSKGPHGLHPTRFKSNVPTMALKATSDLTSGHSPCQLPQGLCTYHSLEPGMLSARCYHG